MGALITDPHAFTALFRDFRRTAYRLEVRRGYGVAYEDEPFQTFLAGGDPGADWLRPWLTLMQEQTGAGKRVERVRVVDTPPSDYLRFEISMTPHNLAAGEDLRYLRRPIAENLALPEYDYWIFDSRRVVFLEFGDDDRFLGFRSTMEPRTVAQHSEWWILARSEAQTFDDYCAANGQAAVSLSR